MKKIELLKAKIKALREQDKNLTADARGLEREHAAVGKRLKKALNESWKVKGRLDCLRLELEDEQGKRGLLVKLKGKKYVITTAIDRRKFGGVTGTSQLMLARFGEELEVSCDVNSVRGLLACGFEELGFMSASEAVILRDALLKLPPRKKGQLVEAGKVADDLSTLILVIS